MFKSTRKLQPWFVEKKFIHMAFDVYQGDHINPQLPPLIIMHGILGRKEDWLNMALTLTQKCKRKIFVVDARNHGQSPHRSTHSSRVLASDILTFVKSQGLSKAALLGHGMGGRAMMYTALKFSSLAERVFVLDTAPVTKSSSALAMEQIFLLMNGIKIPKTHSLFEGQEMMSEMFLRIVDCKENVDFILRNLRKKSNGKFYWTVNVKALMNNIRELDKLMFEGLTIYEGPAMFICCNESNFITPDNWPDIQKVFPNSEIHWVNYGPLIHMDDSLELVQLIVNFLNKS